MSRRSCEEEGIESAIVVDDDYFVKMCKVGKSFRLPVGVGEMSCSFSVPLLHRVVAIVSSSIRTRKCPWQEVS